MEYITAGVDEAGRGPWAGPVSIAAVILNPEYEILGLNDSKKLTEAKRDVLFDEICQHALAVSCVFVNAAQIDIMNIREATLHGMERAIHALSIIPDEILIDGRDVPRGLQRRYSRAGSHIVIPAKAGIHIYLEELDPRLRGDDSEECRDKEGFSARAIIQGDALHPCISAASIVAKVMRDRVMVAMDTQFPHYGFAQHKGYGTAIHAQALKIHGACDIHRKSFAPIRAVLTK